MKNKLFWSMFCINIVLIVVFLVFSLKEKENNMFLGGGEIDTLQQKVIDGFSKTSNVVVQVVAEEKTTYYQEGYSNQNNFLEKSSIQKKGSAIIVSNKGYIITNNHVVDDVNLKYSIITNNGNIYGVNNVRKDDFLDLAIISVNFENKNKTEAKFVDIDSDINIGQFVFAIGNSLSEYINTISFGIISGKGRKIDVENSKNIYYAGLYQTDVALNPGNSGGPLINLSGEVIGMITAISRGGNNIGFALPLNRNIIKATIDSIEENNTLLRPYLGLAYTDTKTGAIVDTVFSGSPVQGQILTKDIILEIDKRKVSIEKPLLYYLYSYKPLDTVIVTILRDSKILSIPIVLGQKTL